VGLPYISFNRSRIYYVLFELKRFSLIWSEISSIHHKFIMIKKEKKMASQ